MENLEIVFADRESTICFAAFFAKKTEMGENMLDYWKGKKIFITGHTGFKGSWLSKILLTAGAELCGYALAPSEESNLFSMLDLESHMRSYQQDVRDLPRLKEAMSDFAPEYVIHMAAQPLVRESYEDPVYTYETNVMGTVHLLESVRHVPSVRSVLNVTTDKVYNNKEWERGYVEEDELDGFDPYSNSKSCSELVTHSYQRSFLSGKGVAVSTARAGNVIGGGDFAKDRIIPDCARAAITGKTMALRNPAAIRPFQHVLEPLFVYLDILRRQKPGNMYEGAFNVGPEDGDCINARTLTEYFKEAWGEGFSFEAVSHEGPHEAGFLKLNCEKLKKVYAWKPKYDIKTAVALTAEWYRAYAAGEDMDAFTAAQIAAYCRH